MRSVKFYAALWAAKLSIIPLRLTGHRGTNYPGRIALKICPDFLRQAGSPGRIIGVTGTNGKTTVCNLLIDMFSVDGVRVLDNNQGSNTMAGLCAAFARDMDPVGRFRSHTAVLEIDERSSRVVFPMISPDILLINNLTRDSIMRNGHPEYISRVLTDAMRPETKLILNGDDLIAASVAPSNPRVYFGIESMEGDVTECINLVNDLQICPLCHSLLAFSARRYHHIGRAHCTECDFSSPRCDYYATAVDVEKMEMTVRHDDGSGKEKATENYPLLNDSVFNIYNVLAVVACMGELGYEPGSIKELLGAVDIVGSRYKLEREGIFTIIRQMSKDRNALGCSRAFDYVASQPGDKEIILMMNNLSDAREWSENTCWLYDCDFEFLNRDNIRNIVATGPRARDYYLRLKMAGIDDERISLVDDELTSPRALKLDSEEAVYILYGTDSIDLADRVAAGVREEIRARGEMKDEERSGAK